MDVLWSDFHIHSRYSYDSILSVESLLSRAKRVGLERIAVTDHNSIQGGIKAKEASRGSGLEVIVGSEVKTDCGDIIGLYLHDEIREVRCDRVIEEIRSQGGLVVLPHPYRGHYSVYELAKKVDFIEIWNSKCSVEANVLAQELASSVNKKVICGSDAHSLSEIGSVKIKSDLSRYSLSEPSILRTTPTWILKKDHIVHMVKKHIVKRLEIFA
jgi:predicted metal-dependent phosphoesterase TrpH